MRTPKAVEVTYLLLERRSAFTAVIPFLLLFALLYSAFGASSPFLPALVGARGISAEQIGIIFGAATAVRLISAPIAGRIADRTQALRTTLGACAIAPHHAPTAIMRHWYLPIRSKKAARASSGLGT